MVPWLAQLSPDLFWDVPLSSVDPVKNQRWLLERVLLRGRWEDWLLLKEHLPRKGVEDTLPRLRVPAREAHFLKLQLESWHA